MDIHEVPPLDIQTIQGPITRARARQLNLEVSSLLSVSINNCENGLLPNFYNVGTKERAREHMERSMEAWRNSKGRQATWRPNTI